MPGGEASEEPEKARHGRRWPFVAAFAVLAAVTLVAIAAWPQSAPPPDSGLNGLVLLGPLAPVEQVGGPPNERPYEATLRVVRAGSDDTVATVHSRDDGRFRVNLAPGAYTVVPEPQGDSLLPSASSVDVTVVSHRFTDVTISFDTGIR